MATKAQVEEIMSRPYAIEFEYGADPSEGMLAYVAEWPDCFGAGRTREEAIAELGTAMRELAVHRLSHGLEIPEANAAYSGRVLLRMPKSLHRLAEKRAKAEAVSMNQWLISAIARELGPATTAAARAPGSEMFRRRRGIRQHRKVMQSRKREK